MKKYSSYFNKRYFPESDELSEEESATPQTIAIEPEAEAEPLTEADVLDLPEMEEPIEEVEAPAPPTPAPTPTPGASFASSYSPYTYSAAAAAPPKPAPQPPMPYAASSVAQTSPTPPSAEATIISKNAIINGELTVSGDVRLYGKIKGNLTAQGNLELAGKVIGNVTGNDVEFSQCELKGDVSATGFVFMDKESIMIGNVSSQDITLDGKVKGDVTALNKVYVRSNAIIVGNVHAATIAIDEGAALQGQVIIANKNDSGINISEESMQKE